MLQTIVIDDHMTPAVKTEPRLTVLSFGGGQDSTAILYRMIHDRVFRARYAPNDLLVVMADTGDEHRDTLEHVEDVKAVCAEHGIEFVHLTPDMGFHSGKWARGLRFVYRALNAIGSIAYPKTCSVNLKLEPMYRFLEVYVANRYGLSKTGRKVALKEFGSIFGKMHVLLGIAKGEESRVADESKDKPWMRLSVRRVYPLLDYGMDRAACQAYIRSIGKRVPPPSNCVLCPFKSKEEILWTALTLPADFAEWCELEANKIAANADKVAADKNYGVKKHALLPQVRDDAYAELRPKFASDAELIAYLTDYRMSHGHCVATKM